MLDDSVPTTPAPLARPVADLSTVSSPIAVGIASRFLQRDSLELARRIVAQLDSPLQLAQDMGLDAAQWAVLSCHPHFLAQMEAARSEANSAAGLADRVRLKALTVLDQGALVDMAGIINDASASTTSRVAAINAVADIAGITKQKDQQASQAGAGPLVQIIMPSAAAGITIGGRIIETTP